MFEGNVYDLFSDSTFKYESNKKSVMISKVWKMIHDNIRTLLTPLNNNEWVASNLILVLRGDFYDRHEVNIVSCKVASWNIWRKVVLTLR